MLSLRIVTATAVFLTLAAGNASAQTATTTAPGKPLQLFQVIQQKDGTATVNPQHRVRYVHRRVARTHIANQTIGANGHTYMQVQPEPEQAAATQPAATPPTTTPAATAISAAATPALATGAAATATAPANIWPAPDLTLSGMQTQTLTLAPPVVPTAAPNEPVTAANPDETMTAAYDAVQVTPPSAAEATPPDITQVTPPNVVNPTDIAADRPHEYVAANTAGPNDAAATWPVQHAMVATEESQNPNPVGSASWIAHVLAALVGAIATGTLAWVLIDPLPVRSYE